MTVGTATLTYAYEGSGDAEGLSCSASLKLTSINVALVPDYDRDGAIDATDRHRASTGEVFRFWINDDADADGDFTISSLTGRTTSSSPDGTASSTGRVNHELPPTRMAQTGVVQGAQ